jgi:hypothetical protein
MKALLVIGLVCGLLVLGLVFVVVRAFLEAIP